MRSAYQNMRHFWIHESKKDVKAKFPELGENNIIIAGIEFSMEDHNKKEKNIFFASSTLGDTSMYFENNSPSGIGGLIAGDDAMVKEASKNLLDAASKAASLMVVSDELPSADLFKTTFFAVSKHTLYTKQLTNEEGLDKENPFHPFFKAANKMLTALRVADAKAKEAQSKELK
ncbi:hypothetical protein Emin_1095 [Elusimicrobium minutum Pei191]|uniref:Uncharacterized protein n=1 Tax=Elusimicrobium minutum (strain Pei191) TaxID=445932 RepID=B2KDQ1_ELUMP|nr:hypothetical protein [Elusimicrobium minutum]ACC98647.1 hypothetical protein Emin_1095 [Elusimicrobium minutum Pei191]